MLGVGEEIRDFNVVGVNPSSIIMKKNGQSAFETITKESFPEK